MIGSFSYQVCYGLARAFLRPPLNRFGFRSPTITRYDSLELYVEERVAASAELHGLFSPFVSFKNKTVVDLGCNTGYLLDSFLSRESFTAIGVDISEELLRRGRERYGDRITFIQNTPTRIPVESNSADVVYSVDTVEHLSRPRETLLEIYRILKPGGIALLHFGPFRNPYGSHLEDILPFPWPHVFFSQKTLLNVAARLYESPDYPVACYSRDEKTGQKKPNPYLDHAARDIFLNHITIRKFNRLIGELPFQVIQQQRIGFGGRTFRVGRAVRQLAQVPYLDEYFCNALYTVLGKGVPDRDQ
ncbi:MAG: class I SAM-dependent methyltransferase [Nitrospirae bacterium]|nr:class I SAM-dependent methyltransferase [Nitrospirota bacterium]